MEPKRNVKAEVELSLKLTKEVLQTGETKSVDVFIDKNRFTAQECGRMLEGKVSWYRWWGKVPYSRTSYPKGVTKAVERWVRRQEALADEDNRFFISTQGEQLIRHNSPTQCFNCL